MRTQKGGHEVSKTSTHYSDDLKRGLSFVIKFGISLWWNTTRKLAQFKWNMFFKLKHLHFSAFA